MTCEHLNRNGVRGCQKNGLKKGKRMTGIKPGDTVKSAVTGRKVEVIAVYGDRLWGIPEGYDKPVSYGPSGWTKVAQFFEVGKKYTYAGDTFEPVRIDTDTDGNRYAYGPVHTPSGNSYWQLKTDLVFSAWTETS